MASSVAWLDASADEQRRVREIVSLFSTRETLDEVGGRRIVVVLSDELFPGTSVLHSRARYVLFVPWLCQLAARRKHPVQALDGLERRLIASFLDQRDRVDIEGLIGRQAGPTIKQLPSTAYWTALRQWGVLAWPGTVAETLHRLATSQRGRGRVDAQAAEELADRAPAVWHEGAVAVPSGFPDDLAGGFDLAYGEAVWLRERLLATTDGSLLGYLAGQARWPDVDAAAPWDDAECRRAPDPIRAVLEDAERFAWALDGARLLYNLLVAERYLDREYTTVAVDLDAYREALVAWGSGAGARWGLFDGWDSREFWAFVRRRNPGVDVWTQQFFDRWFATLRRGDVDGVADDVELRALVTDRERFLKAGLARLGDGRVLATWAGGGTARVTYRWGVVQTLLADMAEGLEGTRAGA